MLSCENLKDCENSLISIFKVDETMIRKIKSEVRNLYLESSDWQLKLLLDKYNITFKNNMSVCFFHFSRTLNPTSYNMGIQTLPSIYDNILEEIASLYKIHTKDDMMKIIEEKLGNITKKRIYDTKDGPHGFLIKKHGSLRDSISELFIDNSETVNDVINALGYDKTLYQSNSKTIIVKFKVNSYNSDVQQKCIKQALEYISLGDNPKYRRFMTYSHDNKGIPVSYEDVLSIEIK
ncbi:hypothetical protein N7603_00565 [Acholeplasma vituli]|uniref:Uncharacterized protein n=1 Tax=Paracholeplasma vituli TaxID=69473 RepID=A0ABT2PWX0_9MOLU|nr:hypothetical protein [Paracholeplasma vituli]MCU0104153.1 hypothetical protein [Paracholeplasma vituli]